MTTPTPYKKPTPRTAMQALTRNIRNTVASWSGRTLRVQHENELVAAYHALAPHAPHLASHSPHAERLLINLKRELQRRELISPA